MKKIIPSLVLLFPFQSFANDKNNNKFLLDFNEQPIKYCHSYSLVVVDEMNVIKSYIEKSKGTFSNWEYLERKSGVPSNEQGIFSLRPTYDSGFNCDDPVLKTTPFLIQFKNSKYQSYDFLISYLPESSKYYYLDSNINNNLEKSIKQFSALFRFIKHRDSKEISNLDTVYELLNCQSGRPNYLDCKDGKWCYSKGDEDLSTDKLPLFKLLPQSKNN